MILKYFSLFVISLLSIAFFTILERKVLSYAQIRKGPNLVGPLGVLQPFSDGLKLLTKKSISPFNSSILFVSPVLFFITSLMVWGFVFSSCSLETNNFFLIILSLSSLGALLVFFSGWNGQSNYSSMGGIRASAQMISYEVAFSFLLLCPISLSFSFSLQDIKNNQIFPNFFSMMFLFPMILVMILAETNRAPFDLTEGESELVSGFNTEFSSVSFTFLFLAEYSFIMFFSFMSSIIFFGSSLFWIFFLFVIIWVRSCFPRKRYDELMNLMWMTYLPLSLILLTFFSLIVWIF